MIATEISGMELREAKSIEQGRVGDQSTVSEDAQLDDISVATFRTMALIAEWSSIHSWHLLPQPEIRLRNCSHWQSKSC
jgi:hypothetical protein